MNELRVALTGERAQLGMVPAADVARLLLLVEKAAAQAAAVVLNQPKTTTGRYRGVIEQAVHFRLRAVEPGSVVPVLELPARAPSEDGTLSMDVVTLGESAVAMLLDSAAEQPHPPHPAVAKALLEVADGMYVGDRYEAVTLQARGDGRPVRTARIDRTVRSRLRAYVDSEPAAPTRSDALMGVLVEADFERRTARLRTATEPAVEVDFPEQLDDDIHAALRQPATLRGEVVYDPKTHSAKTVHLRQLDRGEQLVLGVDPTEFWSEPSFDELARRQGAGHPIDPDAIYDADATDDERDAFLAAISDLGQVQPQDVPEGPLAVDTDAFSLVYMGKGRRDEFAALIAGHPLAMPFAVVGELKVGAIRGGLGQRRRDELDAAIGACVVIPTDARVVDQWAALRARLIGRLKGEGVNDLWVAACCLVHDLPLVTNNLRDYQTIATDFPALRLVHPDL